MRLTPTKRLELESYEVIRACLKHIVRATNAIMKRNLIMKIIPKLARLKEYELSEISSILDKVIAAQNTRIDFEKETVRGSTHPHVIRRLHGSITIKKYIPKQ